MTQQPTYDARTQIFVAPDAPARIKQMRRFRIAFWYGSGAVEVDAVDAADAERKAQMQFSDLNLMVQLEGSLEFGKPEEMIS